MPRTIEGEQRPNGRPPEGELTLFGFFATELSRYIGRLYGDRQAWTASRVVKALTNQNGNAERARYLYHYLPRQVAKRIIGEFADNDYQEQALYKYGRGYRLTDDAFVVREALNNAIENWRTRCVEADKEDRDSVAGDILFIILDNGLRPDGEFCSLVSDRFNIEIGDPGVTLQDSIAMESCSLDSETTSFLVFKRLLVASLLGRDAIPVMIDGAIAGAVTPRKDVSPRTHNYIGFYLEQIVMDRGVVGLDNLKEFSNDVCFAIGRESSSEEVGYAPLRPTGDGSWVISRKHAWIYPAECLDGGARWILEDDSSHETAILHPDGSVDLLRKGDAVGLVPGDEIWLAPYEKDGRPAPDFEHGSVLRFGYLLC